MVRKINCWEIEWDLNIQIEEGVNWSPRNLWFKRQLVSEYSKVNQPDSELENIKPVASEVELVKLKYFLTLYPFYRK